MATYQLTDEDLLAVYIVGAASGGSALASLQGYPHDATTAIGQAVNARVRHDLYDDPALRHDILTFLTAVLAGESPEGRTFMTTPRTTAEG